MKRKIGLGVVNSGAVTPSILSAPKFGNNISVLNTSGTVYVMAAVDEIVGKDGVTYTKIQHRYTKKTGAPNAYNSSLICPTTTNIGSTTGGNSVVIGTDDIAPAFINNNHIGSGHGWMFIYKAVIKTGTIPFTHADIGMSLSNGTRTIYLIALDTVNPTTTAYFIGQNTGTTDRFNYSTATLTGTYTQEAPSANSMAVADYTITGGASVGLYGLGASYLTNNLSCNGYVTTVKLDGADVPIGTTYADAISGKSLSIRNTYNICHLANEMSYIISHKGLFAANPTFAYTSPLATYEITTIYEDYGVIKSYQKITLLVDASLGTAGSGNGGMQTSFIQIGSGSGGRVVLGGTAWSRTAYCPNILDSAGLGYGESKAAWTPAATIVISANLRNAASPPVRFVQTALSDAANSELLGLCVGAFDAIYDYVPTSRLANTTKYLETTTLKTYLRAWDGKSDTLNNVRAMQFFTYWRFFKPFAYSTSGQVYWVNYKNYAMLFLDYHASATETLTLPTFFANANWSVIESTAGFAFAGGATSGTLTSSQIGVVVAVTGGVGEYAVLRVKK